jgi:hypothetical protein
LPSFSEAMAVIEESGTPVAPVEDNSEETLNSADDFGTDDTGEEDADDNSEETGQGGAFDPNSITDPQLKAVYQQMQAAFTPKLQEAARLREQFSDLQPEVVDTVREFGTLLKQNPAAAREYLAQQVAWMDQQLGIQQQPDPFANIEPLTPTEEALVNWGRQAWQRDQERERELAQLRFQRQEEANERHFAQLETKYKTAIPLEDKQEVQAYMQRSGISDVEVAWKVLNFDKATQIGKQKAAEVTAKKKKSPLPPTNKQPRTSPTPAKSNAKGITGHFEEAWNQFGG